MKLKEQVDYIVYGFVQGVGFRYFVYTNAVRLKLTGYVKNNFDGTVRIIAEGEEESHAEFLNRLNTGPSRARIDKIETIHTGYSGTYTGFEIK